MKKEDMFDSILFRTLFGRQSAAIAQHLKDGHSFNEVKKNYISVCCFITSIVRSYAQCL